MSTDRQAVELLISGQVQGVGFRPFVKKLANDLSIAGSVKNSHRGVVIQASANDKLLQQFVSVIHQHPGVRNVQHRPGNSSSNGAPHEFVISPAEISEPSLNLCLSPDRSPCAECQRDMLAPDNRRFSYPFTSCTQCGPRYCVSSGAPYDRTRTSFAQFMPCQRCQAEYDDESDRRFHAQTICCPHCGPQLVLRNAEGAVQSTETQTSLQLLVNQLNDGQIVVVKGLSGFHLLADPTNRSAVQRLRELKSRPRKPLALLYPNIDSIAQHCLVSAEERTLLSDPASPLVLLRVRPDIETRFQNVASGNTRLATMLPANGIHLLLMERWQRPLIATSANRQGSRLIGDYVELREQFGDAFDLVLDHNLRLQNTIDDSIAQVVAAQPTLLRPGRGFTPLYAPLNLAPEAKVPPTLALGSFLKNTLATMFGDSIYLSPYLGDLGDLSVRELRDRLFDDITRSIRQPMNIIVDRHPDFPLPESADRQLVASVQHHLSHALVCEWEHTVKRPYLAVTWDGIGYAGSDEGDADNRAATAGSNTRFWGGEFFLVDENSVDRCASFLPVALLGGDLAQREPRRIALAMLLACDIDPEEFWQQNQPQWNCGQLSMLIHSQQSGRFSSSAVGKLLDGIASLLNICHFNSYDGEGPMSLQSVAEHFAYSNDQQSAALPYSLISGQRTCLLDWRPTVKTLVSELRLGGRPSMLAHRVWQTLTDMLIDIARRYTQSRITLGGGCFQNALLLRQLHERCKEEKIELFWPKRIPCNDSGIAVGQLLAANKAYGRNFDSQAKYSPADCVD